MGVLPPIVAVQTKVQAHAVAGPLDVVNLPLAVLLAPGFEREQLGSPGHEAQLGNELLNGHATHLARRSRLAIRPGEVIARHSWNHAALPCK
jgi:hypothetical protein